MSDISTWSSLAANNNSAAPNGAPEGMNPSDVNNVQREVMAAVRRQHEDAQWIDYGDTPTYSSTTVFLISGDVTADYDIGRRVRVEDATTLYGNITASSYSSPNTSVTVSLDSGSLSASIASVSLGILSGSNHSLPKTSANLGNVTVDTVNGIDIPTDIIVKKIVSDHIRAGNMYLYVADSISTSFDVVGSLSASDVWESVGPTGSGADHIFTAMDVIPSTARAMIVNITARIATAAPENYSAMSVSAVDGDTSPTVSSSFFRIIYLHYDPDTGTGDSGEIQIEQRVVIPLNSSQVFKVLWDKSLGNDRESSFIEYRGFIDD